MKLPNRFFHFLPLNDIQGGIEGHSTGWYKRALNRVREFMALIMLYHIVKNLGIKCLANKYCRKFGKISFGKLKSICDQI